jgi:hypothetical protein
MANFEQDWLIKNNFLFFVRPVIVLMMRLLAEAGIAWL